MKAMAVAVVFLVGACTHAAPVDRAADESGIRAAVATLVTSWNSKDAAGFASVFAGQHDYVAVDGQLRMDLTPESNAAAHEQVWRFAYPEGSTIRMEIMAVRFPAPDVAVVQIANHNDFTRAGQQQTLTSSITGVLVRHGADWKITAFNNNAGQGGPPPRPPAGAGP